MRKQNSSFQAAFLSEAGGELENNDYFACVELDQYACYVIADGLNEEPDGESARLAIETVLLAFQEHPSIRRKALLTYLKSGNNALAKAKSRSRLKASVTVVVTDYTHIRYACAGNTRFRMYREGLVKEQSLDMSLGRELAGEGKIPGDALARHEERNNLHTWMGQGKGFRPFVSKKIRLADGDILNLYTRGIWENLDEGELGDVFSEAKEEPRECLDNIEDMLLSRQPERLENYTFVSIFVNKVFTDPNKKRRLRKILTVSVVILTFLIVAASAVWILYQQRVKRTEELDQKLSGTLEYIRDNNYIRAGKECEAALETAEKLKDKEAVERVTAYLRLIEAVNQADEEYGKQEYGRAREDYMAALERSRQADHVGAEYINKRLETIADYLAVFDHIRLGDSLAEKLDYARAEEKYLEARRLATRIYFEEGRREALEALERLYEAQAREEAERDAILQEAAAEEAAAAELVSRGDKAFAEGDYEGAGLYYTIAEEKYRKLADETNTELSGAKRRSCEKKAKEKEEKKELAEEHLAEGKAREEAGDFAEAKKQYLLAKEIYTGLQEEEKIRRTESLMERLEIDQQEQQREEEKQAAEAAAASPAQTVSGNTAE